MKRYNDLLIVLFILTVMLFCGSGVQACGGYGLGFGAMSFNYFAPASYVPVAPAAAYGAAASYTAPAATTVTTTTTYATPTIVLGQAGYSSTTSYSTPATISATQYLAPTVTSVYSYSAYPVAYTYQPFALFNYGSYGACGYGGCGSRVVGSFHGFGRGY